MVIRLIAIVVLQFVACAFTLSLAMAAERPLNLLYITADDMNWDSSGWMGSKAGATPALDALAAQSHRFVHHHVTAPICMPSREAMMTGRVPHRSGGLGFVPIQPGTPTLVTTLKSAGYYTAVINKVAHMKPNAEFPWDDSLTGSGKNPSLLREHFETTLNTAASSKKPFFINVNIQDPHRPFPGSGAADQEDEEATPRAKKKAQAKPRKAAKLAGAKTAGLARIYKPEEVTVPVFLEDIPPVREEVAQYFTGVARFDLALKGILDALAQSGHADDTIIFFASDHGMSFPFSKATVYYNGTRSPAILKFPGMPAATTHVELVSSVDIMPTLLDLLSISPPAGMDGRSWLPLLRGEEQEDRDYVITHVNTVSSGASFPQRCIRTKDSALMFHAWPDGTEKFRVEAMSGITFKALADAAGSSQPTARRVKQLRVGEPLLFFDERSDPGERNNLIDVAGSKPEVERMASLLLAHMEKTGDPQLSNFRSALLAWRSNSKD